MTGPVEANQPEEPHSELRRGVLGVALGVALGAFAVVFGKRRSGDRRPLRSRRRTKGSA